VLITFCITGITGFETASNYVEEMRDPGVFVTTVSWLWYALWWCYCSYLVRCVACD
jgi:amino acid transporter